MKKSAVLTLLALLLPLFSFLSYPASVSAGASAYRPGDIDGDSEITVADYRLLKNYLLGAVLLDPAAQDACDVNRDGHLNTTDYLMIRRHILGTYVIPDISDTPVVVAYIPLDDRPVNTDRVRYLAASAGITLLMPDTDLFATKLDGTGTNANGTQIGDRAALLQWLREADAQCDFFVLSVDQLLSGGLVGSRALRNTDLSFETEIIDAVAALCQNNRVFLFDTVMRLASTVGFEGYGMTEYNALRAYGALPRRTLDGGSLTVENIVAGYRTGETGQTLSTALPSSAINDYLAARERKLRISSELLKKTASSRAYYFLGVDDSSPQVTIQTNEINYFSSLLGENGTVFAGADELGVMALTRLCGQAYQRAAKVTVAYSGGAENLAADGFDIESLDACLKKHLLSAGCTVVSSDADLCFVVLTRPVNGKTSAANACEAMDRVNANLASGIPTVLIDASGDAAQLASLLLNNPEKPARLLGYSSWNTVGNAIGLALSQGVCRWSFLSARADTQAAAEGFLRSMAFALAKDIGYKAYGYRSASQLSALVSRALSGSTYISSLSPYGTAVAGTVTLSDLIYPWHRDFEATFTIHLS